jgi:hypothetical protein
MAFETGLGATKKTAKYKIWRFSLQKIWGIIL